MNLHSIRTRLSWQYRRLSHAQIAHVTAAALVVHRGGPLPRKLSDLETQALHQALAYLDDTLHRSHKYASAGTWEHKPEEHLVRDRRRPKIPNDKLLEMAQAQAERWQSRIRVTRHNDAILDHKLR